MALSAAPTVYVIAGPNGAGKTTFATEFLPKVIDCPQFLNADLIAAGLSPLAPESQNLRAGRLLLERFHELAFQRSDFGFETTLSGRTYWRLLSGLRKSGYRILAFFLWLPSAELAVARVANRVRQGGHDVPESDIRRRFVSGLANFTGRYQSLFDEWWIYNAAVFPPRVIVRNSGETEEIVDTAAYEVLQRSRI